MCPSRYRQHVTGAEQLGQIDGGQAFGAAVAEDVDTGLALDVANVLVHAAAATEQGFDVTPVQPGFVHVAFGQGQHDEFVVGEQALDGVAQAVVAQAAKVQLGEVEAPPRTAALQLQVRQPLRVQLEFHPQCIAEVGQNALLQRAGRAPVLLQVLVLVVEGEHVVGAAAFAGKAQADFAVTIAVLALAVVLVHRIDDGLQQFALAGKVGGEVDFGKPVQAVQPALPLSRVHGDVVALGQQIKDAADVIMQIAMPEHIVTLQQLGWAHVDFQLASHAIAHLARTDIKLAVGVIELTV